MEIELAITRKRLLIFMRCSISRKNNSQLVRRIDCYEEEGDESTVSLERDSDSDTEEEILSKLVEVINHEL